MNTRNKILVTVLTALSISGLSYYYISYKKSAVIQQASAQSGFFDYDEARDKKDILAMFVTERYWLLSSDDYDPEFMLDYKAPSKNPTYVGKLHIKVLRENGKFVGFTTFYKTTVTEGQILFVAVNEAFRGKGNAKKLTQYAFDSLVRMGVKRVWLLTRSQNVRAQAVYKKLGFEVFEVDPEGYIYFEKMAP